jgi:outer membrane protein, heavy metal efflux system
MKRALDRPRRLRAAIVAVFLAACCLEPMAALAQQPTQLLPARPPSIPVPILPPLHGQSGSSTIWPLPEAVRFAVENNPLLAAVREQRGVAAGGVVIARTYPYNPLLQSFVLADGGPISAGITNRVFNEDTMRLDLEIRGQGKHRRAAASATVSRTEWEIAAQEMSVAIAAIRAYNSVLYRQKKLELVEETVRLDQQVVDQVRKLVEQGRLRPADLIVARTELSAARAAGGQGLTALAIARSDLRRQLGIVDDTFVVVGDLELPVQSNLEVDSLSQAALERRPDLQARRAMVAEAQARLKLQIADRFGNPSVGPGFEYNETSVTFVGMWLVTPIPILNTHRGEIMQRQADLGRALADVRQFEVQSIQDAQAALARLEQARQWSNSYTNEVLPELRKARADLDKLFAQNEPGVDLLRVIGVQRNYLRSLDAHLDAQFEVSQARADLAAAVADPALAMPCQSPVAPAP